MTVVALALLAVMLVMLIVGGDITFGSGTAPQNLANWPHDVLALAGLATVGIALASPSARLPVAMSVFAVSAVVGVFGPTKLLTFYDAWGLGLGLGFACLVALWLAAIGRKSRLRGWDDAVLRLAVYLTMGVILVPAGFVVAADITCAHNSDDMCALGGVVFGFPVAVTLWLAILVAGEVVALRRRRVRRGHQV